MPVTFSVKLGIIHEKLIFP